jgi:hypothetical protein
MNRRGYLGALATAGLASVAGCSEVARSVADATPADLNISSEVDVPIAVPVTIEGPDGVTVFSRSSSFTEGEGTQQYDDIWETTGNHTVRATVEAEIETGTAGGSGSGPAITRTVTIPHPDASLVVDYRADGFEIGIFGDFS